MRRPPSTSRPGVGEFLDRMAWLPALLQRLDQPAPLDG
jgi:hypothetical protein